MQLQVRLDDLADRCMVFKSWKVDLDDSCMVFNAWKVDFAGSCMVFKAWKIDFADSCMVFKAWKLVLLTVAWFCMVFKGFVAWQLRLAVTSRSLCAKA